MCKCDVSMHRYLITYVEIDGEGISVCRFNEDLVISSHYRCDNECAIPISIKIDGVSGKVSQLL